MQAGGTRSSQPPSSLSAAQTPCSSAIARLAAPRAPLASTHTIWSKRTPSCAPQEDGSLRRRRGRTAATRGRREGGGGGRGRRGGGGGGGGGDRLLARGAERVLRQLVEKLTHDRRRQRLVDDRHPTLIELLPVRFLTAVNVRFAAISRPWLE
eukprot:SAG11_NODE_1990_length_3957_cov_4.708917_2_plen_153_part_00